MNQLNGIIQGKLKGNVYTELKRHKRLEKEITKLIESDEMSGDELINQLTKEGVTVYKEDLESIEKSKQPEDRVKILKIYNYLIYGKIYKKLEVTDDLLRSLTDKISDLTYKSDEVKKTDLKLIHYINYREQDKKVVKDTIKEYKYLFMEDKVISDIIVHNKLLKLVYDNLTVYNVDVALKVKNECYTNILNFLVSNNIEND